MYSEGSIGKDRPGTGRNNGGASCDSKLHFMNTIFEIDLSDLPANLPVNRKLSLTCNSEYVTNLTIQRRFNNVIEVTFSYGGCEFQEQTTIPWKDKDFSTAVVNVECP